MEAGWDRCLHFLPRKQRYCNMARTPGQQFCGVHLAESSKGERIPCPVDPSHTVWSGLLAAHLKVCNTATANKMLESMPFYQKVSAHCQEGRLGGRLRIGRLVVIVVNDERRTSTQEMSPSKRRKARCLRLR